MKMDQKKALVKTTYEASKIENDDFFQLHSTVLAWE